MPKITKFKRFLFEKQIKQVDVARATGIYKQVISDIANGRRHPTLSQALKIANYLGTTVEELFPINEMEEVY